MAQSFAKAFYNSAAWQRVRMNYITEKHGLCERCGKPGLIVHHRKYLTPKNINNPKLTLDGSNLELLCQDCHNAEHSKRQKGRCEFDVSGNISPLF